MLAAALVGLVVLGLPTGVALYRRNLALEERVGMLSADAHGRTVDVARLAAALARAPRTALQISTHSGDPEAYRVAAALGRAALAGHWEPGAIGLALGAGPPVVGLRIFVVGKEGDLAPPAVQVLVLALREQGLGPVEIWPDANLGPNDVRVVVGVKPNRSTTAAALTSR